MLSSDKILEIVQLLNKVFYVSFYRAIDGEQSGFDVEERRGAGNTELSSQSSDISPAYGFPCHSVQVIFWDNDSFDLFFVQFYDESSP